LHGNIFYAPLDTRVKMGPETCTALLETQLHITAPLSALPRNQSSTLLSREGPPTNTSCCSCWQDKPFSPHRDLWDRGFDQNSSETVGSARKPQAILIYTLQNGVRYRGCSLQTSPAISLKGKKELETAQPLSSKLQQGFQNHRNHSRNVVAIHLRNWLQVGNLLWQILQ